METQRIRNVNMVFKTTIPWNDTQFLKDHGLVGLFEFLV